MNEGILAFEDRLPQRSPWIPVKTVMVAGSRATCRAAVVIVPVAAVMAASGLSAEKLLTITGVSAIWIAALRGSYSGPGPSPLVLGTGTVTCVGTVSGLAVISLLGFWLPGLAPSTGQLLLMALAVFGMSWTFEAKMQWLGSRRRLVLVGADDAVHELLGELELHPDLPFDVVGVVGDDPFHGGAGVPRLGASSELATIVRDERPDLVVLGAKASRAEALSHVLDVASLDVRVVDVHHFNEHAFGKVPVRHLSPVWFMGVLHLYQRPYSRIAKRTFDVVVASIALLLVAPLLLAVCFALRAFSRGPVFFHQLRLGEAGTPFEIRKFRTMVDLAEEPGMAVWAEEDDPRVTRIGRILRRTRIDELPQLYNVLRGDMSIVGPRPERPEFLQLLQETVPFWTRRHLVKPGITGWAQVRRGYTGDVMGTAEKLSYDLYYLKYRSLWLDLAIASRTLAIVLSGFGSR